MTTDAYEPFDYWEPMPDAPPPDIPDNAEWDPIPQSEPTSPDTTEPDLEE